MVSPTIGFYEVPGTNMADNEEGNRLLNTKYFYPGGDAASSTQVFLSLYEEEEAWEEPGWLGDDHLYPAYSNESRMGTGLGNMRRPSVFFVSRLFDSIIGFHKGCLDLSGRHPERYYQLQRQWNKFLWGLLNLQMVQEPPEYLDLTGHLRTGSERWRRFLAKWRLPESTCYGQLIKCVQNVLRELRQHPIPIFQMKHLIELPSEVLDIIVDMTSALQTKALSNTCHKLNDIGRRHLFKVWRMKLSVPSYVSPFNIEFSSFDIPTVAKYCRLDLQKNADFILHSPHVCQRIKTLVLADEWSVSRRAQPYENNPFALGMEFYTSVTKIYSSVLRAVSNVTTVILHNLEINVDLLRKLADVPNLHTLELHLCHIPRPVCRRLASDTLLSCARITNLRIFMDSSFADTHSQWFAILLCPNIRTLSVVQYGVGPFPAPDPLFWKHCSLNNLERLALDNIDVGDLAEFTRFFKHNRPASVYLTHFKLHMEWGISDAEVLTLLFALHSAPLEVLVLEGLAEAEFVMFKQIAFQYPMLHALTVIRRENSSQHNNKLAAWPHASWEYAPHFIGFRALRYFCWNFRTEYWDATPSTLVAFELGFPPPSSFAASRHCHSGSADYYDLTDDVPPYFLDTHLMALPFAAHCPTLQSFSIMDRTIDMVCRIKRHPTTGTPQLTAKYYQMHSFAAWDTQQWNTWGPNWPALLPLPQHERDY